MKTTNTLILIGATTAAGLLLAGCAQTVQPETTATPTAAAEATTTPTPTATVAPAVDLAAIYAANPAPTNLDSNGLLAWEALMGPEGEYAAAASYLAVLDAYGQVEPYASIYQQELKHIDALVRQLSKYGVTAPANPYVGVIAAPTDLATAAQAWAEGEVHNITMYDNLIAQSTDSRLTSVLENLRSASLNNHLPLFQEAAANGGTTP